MFIAPNMRLSFTSAVLAASVPALVSAIPQPKPSLAPPIPLSEFPTNPLVKPLTVEETANFSPYTPPKPSELFKVNAFAADVSIQANCAAPRIRYEWDNASSATRQNFINGVRCLMGRPSAGGFPGSRNRYEDLVVVHQQSFTFVHGNSVFMPWHRYYLWVFEDVMRVECGFTDTLPWFDESRYSGRFPQSSIFTPQWLGGVDFGGQCVTNGQFAGITLNIGPGSTNRAHCLSRNNDNSKTSQTNSASVDNCYRNTFYPNMASCIEGGVHAQGHNGIGAVMQDPWSSPSDPVFWLHHAWIDRIWRIWQGGDPARITNAGLGGTDSGGGAITMDTWLHSGNIRPSKQIKDIISTVDERLCYRYNY